MLTSGGSSSESSSHVKLLGWPLGTEGGGREGEGEGERRRGGRRRRGERGRGEEGERGGNSDGK